MLEVKKTSLYSGKDASQLLEKRKKVVTVGCFKTDEILFAAATNYLLVMSAYFKGLDPENPSFYKSGIKTTERIIGKLQGKQPKFSL